MDSDGKPQGKRDRSKERKRYGLGANPPGASVSREQMERYDFYQERYQRYLATHDRFDLVGKPDGTVLHIKPLQYTLGLGVPGLLLMLSALWMHFTGESYGLDFRDAQGNHYIGLVKLLGMLLGGIMLIIAWPIRKPRGWTVEQQEQYEDSKIEAANKRWKEH